MRKCYLRNIKRKYKCAQNRKHEQFHHGRNVSFGESTNTYLINHATNGFIYNQISLMPMPVPMHDFFRLEFLGKNDKNANKKGILSQPCFCSAHLEMVNCSKISITKRLCCPQKNMMTISFYDGFGRNISDCAIFSRPM